MVHGDLPGMGYITILQYRHCFRRTADIYAVTILYSELAMNVDGLTITLAHMILDSAIVGETLG